MQENEREEQWTLVAATRSAESGAAVGINKPKDVVPRAT
jgi:hypothetical protein